MGMVETGLERIGVNEWENMNQDQKKWREFMQTTKNLVEQYKPIVEKVGWYGNQTPIIMLAYDACFTGVMPEFCLNLYY